MKNNFRHNYSHGVYVIREDLSYFSQVKSYIEELGFLDQSEHKEIRGKGKGRKRSQTISTCIPGSNKEFVLKRFYIHPAYKFSRKVDLFFTSIFKDYSRVAYFGSLALESAGIPTAKAVAFWSYKRNVFFSEKFFLYEAIDADATLFSHYQQSKKDDAAALKEIESTVIKVIKKIYSLNMRHGDPQLENFLVKYSHTNDSKEKFSIYLIDTDHFSKSHINISYIKKVFDLKCLASINIDKGEKKEFVKHFLGEEYSFFWWWVFVFWSNGGIKFNKWSKTKRRA